MTHVAAFAPTEKMNLTVLARNNGKINHESECVQDLSIGDRQSWCFGDRDFIDDGFDERDLSRRSTFGPACERHSLTIHHRQGFETGSRRCPRSIGVRLNP